MTRKTSFVISSFLFLLLIIQVLVFIPNSTAQAVQGDCVALLFSGGSIDQRAAVSSDTITWTGHVVGNSADWEALDYGAGRFVAVASTGGATNAMTSSDGETWTLRTTPQDNDWRDVIYSPDESLFVAVASSGANRVMTSANGISWSLQSAPGLPYRGVAYGNGVFVAVSNGGTGSDAVTSPDGITWTQRTTANTNQWMAVTFGNGLFVAVSNTGSLNRVMTSPDGITWTARTTANTNFFDVTYGNGLYVAVGASSSVSTSPDGITWTLRTTPVSSPTYEGVDWSGTNFVAVATGLTETHIITSPDGITWTERTDPFGAHTYGDVNCIDEILAACELSDEDCTATRNPDTQFQDVRVSYETTPSIYVRELGDTQAKRQNFGNVTLFDESLTQLVSNQPCDDGTFGTDGWTYTPNDSKHRGLAVTTDEFVVVTCLTGKLAVSDFAVMKILSPSSLTAIRTTGSVGDVTPTRIDAFTRNLASMPTIQDTFRHVDPLNGQAGDFFSQGGALGMSTISPQSGLSTAVGNPGVSIFDATSDINALPLVSTGSISANAAVVNETQIWISDSSAGHLYNWTVGGFVLQTSDSDYKITTRQDAAGIRLTKDEDFLLHWTGSTVRIGHTQNFTDVYTATLSSTIQGCDADILNNYLYCVTPTTVERLFIANDIPTVWGLNKTGLTASNNTTVIAAIGATFTDSATDSGVSTSPGVTSPGAEGGFVEDTDNFFGVPIQPIADDFGTSITQVKWLIGIFLVALTAVTLGAVTMSGVGLLIGVGVGVAWATAMGFFPIWLILFVMFLILLLIGKGIAGG